MTACELSCAADEILWPWNKYIVTKQVYNNTKIVLLRGMDHFDRVPFLGNVCIPFKACILT